MKKLFFIVFFCSSLISFSQECKFKIKEKDQFTGEIKIQTKHAYLLTGMAQQYTAYISKVGSLYFFDLEHGSMSFNGMVVGKSDKIILKLSNDSIVELYPADIYSSEIISSGSFIHIRYKINREQIAQLSKNKIANFRLYYNNNYIDHKTTAHGSENIKHYALCLLNE